MNPVKESLSLFAGAAATLALTLGAATAADQAFMPGPAMDHLRPAFHWDGFYAGAGIGGAALTTGTYADLAVEPHAIAGYNYTFNNFLIGPKVTAGTVSTTSGILDLGVSGELRGGILITPQTLLYATAGGLRLVDTGVTYGFVGAGAEFAVTDNVTMSAEYLYLGWSNTVLTGHSAAFSTLWHFN